MKQTFSAIVWWRRLFAFISVVMATLYFRDAFGDGPVAPNAIKGGVWVVFALAVLVLELRARRHRAAVTQE